MIPKIALYHLQDSLNYYGNIFAQNSLIIDSRLGADILDVLVLDILHEKLKTDTKNAHHIGEYNNKKYMEPTIKTDLMKLLSKKEIPEDLENRWNDGDLLIVPLFNIEFIEKHQSWEDLIIQSFKSKSSFAMVSNTVIYSKYIDTLKNLITESNSKIQLIKEI